MHSLFLVSPRDCVKTSRKTPLSPHLKPNCFEREHYSLFVALLFAVVLKTDSTHSNNSFKRRKEAVHFFLLVCCPFGSRTTTTTAWKDDEKKLLIRRTLEATKTRDQNLFWFSGNLLHAMPCHAKPYHNIALPSFWTQTFAWPNKKTIRCDIVRNETVFYILNKKREDEAKIATKKYPAKDTHSLAHLFSFFFKFVCVWIIFCCCTIATILSEHILILKNRIGMNIEAKPQRKTRKSMSFPQFSFKRISWSHIVA